MDRIQQSYSFARSQTQTKEFRELVLYVAFGLTALAVELGIFFIALNWFIMPLLLANFAAIFSGMVVSFGLNSALNFQVNDNLLKRFTQYSVVVGLGYVVSSAIILGLVELSVDAFIAKLAALPAVFILQFILNKRFAFSK